MPHLLLLLWSILLKDRIEVLLQEQTVLFDLLEQILQEVGANVKALLGLRQFVFEDSDAVHQRLMGCCVLAAR